MNRKEFIRELEKSNRYCPCPELQRLYWAVGEVRERRKSCDFFARNHDLGMTTAKDLPFTLDYQRAIQELKSAVTKYKAELNNQAAEHRLKFIGHNIKCGSQKPVRLEEAVAVQKDEESVLTIHCANCSQQIEIL